MSRKSKKIIFIDQHRVEENLRTDSKALPVIGIKIGRMTGWGNKVDIKDQQGNVVATVKFHPEKPLKTGQTVSIELIDSEVDIYA